MNQVVNISNFDNKAQVMGNAAATDRALALLQKHSIDNADAIKSKLAGTNSQPNNLAQLSNGIGASEDQMQMQAKAYVAQTVTDYKKLLEDPQERQLKVMAKSLLKDPTIPEDSEEFKTAMAALKDAIRDVDQPALDFAVTGNPEELEGTQQNVLPEGVSGAYSRKDNKILLSTESLGGQNSDTLKKVVTEEVSEAVLAGVENALGQTFEGDGGDRLASVLGGATVSTSIDSENAGSVEVEALVDGELQTVNAFLGLLGLSRGSGGGGSSKKPSITEVFNPARPINAIGELVAEGAVKAWDGYEGVLADGIDIAGAVIEDTGQFVNQFKDMTVNAVEDLGSDLAKVGKYIYKKSYLEETANKIGKSITEVGNFFEDVASDIAGGVNDLKNYVEKGITWLGEQAFLLLIKPILDLARKGAEKVKSVAGDLPEKAKEFFLDEVVPRLGSVLGAHPDSFGAAGKEGLALSAVEVPDKTEQDYSFREHSPADGLGKILSSSKTKDMLTQVNSLFHEHSDKHEDAFFEQVFGGPLSGEQKTKFREFFGKFNSVANESGGSSEDAISQLQDELGITFGTFGSKNNDLFGYHHQLSGELALSDRVFNAFDAGSKEQEEFAVNTFLEELVHSAATYAGIPPKDGLDSGRATTNYLVQSMISGAADGHDVIPEREIVQSVNGANNSGIYDVDGKEVSGKLDSFQLSYGIANSFRINGVLKPRKGLSITFVSAYKTIAADRSNNNKYDQVLTLINEGSWVWGVLIAQRIRGADTEAGYQSSTASANLVGQFTSVQDQGVYKGSRFFAGLEFELGGSSGLGPIKRMVDVTGVIGGAIDINGDGEIKRAGLVGFGELILGASIELTDKIAISPQSYTSPYLFIGRQDKNLDKAASVEDFAIGA